MIRREYKGVNRVSLSDLQASLFSPVQITDVLLFGHNEAAMRLALLIYSFLRT